MQFELPLTVFQLFIPVFCTGILAGGLVLYGYMAISYRTQVYIRLTILTLIAIVFVGSEMFVLGTGALKHDWQFAIHFNQSCHLAGAFFIFGLPYYLDQILVLNPTWRKYNMRIAYAGLAYAIICVISIFINPDLFISDTIHKATWLRFEADYGRGAVGPLYHIRDLLLGLEAFYAIICIAIDLKINRNFSYLLFPIIGVAFALCGAAIDIGFVYNDINYDLFPHEYFSRFSLGITVLILCFMSALTRHFISISKEIERAHLLISISEEKYRVLVEGTNDLIFTLDGDLRFLSANNATTRQFGITEEVIRTKQFFDFIHFDESTMQSLEKDLIMDKVRALESKRRPVMFKASLLGNRNIDPKEFEIRLEYINIEGKNEIIGKASVIADNTLMRYLESESQQYSVGNQMILAEEVVKRLVLNLSKYMTPNEIMQIRIGLREIIINSIEHGNLNITFEEKSKATMSDNYLEFVASRQSDPAYRDRRVVIKYSLTDKRVMYSIEDEGEGFDYNSVLALVHNKKNDNLAHGRGMFMALGIFDKIIYNDRGNKVFLVRKLTGEEIDDEEFI